MPTTSFYRSSSGIEPSINTPVCPATCIKPYSALRQKVATSITPSAGSTPTPGSPRRYLSAYGAQLRTDLPVKVLRFVTESEVTGTSSKQVPVAELDSDHFRRWEVAGSSHLDFHVTGAFGPLLVRDFATPPTPPCDLPPHSRVPA